ncbi:Bcr/CflA family drug resistance efflux transporter [marine bacterium AO1-C]|nr:Bcr/CflA family drug resistance efflux transporter [marine bacterium AO1-C]
MTSITQNKGKTTSTKELEFIAIMAFLMSNVALAIDAILPALTHIGHSLHEAKASSLQLIITMIFLGLGIGQLIFGTLSDSFGRKPTVYWGVGIFMLASFICVTAATLEMMLLGRVLQGVGLSAPRTVSISIIRDSYSGDRMARIMSFISVIFILIPMIAPVLGQVILLRFSWQAIFYFQLVFITITVVWFQKRQPETLPESQRVSFSRKEFVKGFKEFFKFRNTVIFTIIEGLMEGSFILYLSVSKQVFQDQYQLVDEFPYIFAGIAFMLGLATFINGALVTKYGMKKLVARALILFSILSLGFLLLFPQSTNPPLFVLLFFLTLQFISYGFILGNLSALALQPIGHIAGTGASVFSVISTIISVFLAVLAGRYLTTTVAPLFVTFFGSSVVALLLLSLTKRKIQKQT